MPDTGSITAALGSDTALRLSEALILAKKRYDSAVEAAQKLFDTGEDVESAALAEDECFGALVAAATERQAYLKELSQAAAAALDARPED
jgi:hypothetical protein